ncbi:hypothetical protein VPNG_00238 [Cytospora leucostoma]|uniref:Fructose-bisphosphatase n=1 Tax=Cytospora leucostoma TaxID=1230097 RepID=A0A423XNW5_9PEZI|nr:hypothetical protein VPNG_00238 [Cytospora leucostoma]
MSSQATQHAHVSLTSFLQEIAPQDGSRKELFTSVIPAVIDAVGDIAKALQKAHRVEQTGSENVFGDDQLNVDVAAEKIIRDVFESRVPSVVTASSEEDPVEKPVHPGTARPDDGGGATENYTIGFDPLDGSSIITPNWTVGTILGVWDGPTAVGKHAAEQQVASVLGLYGPRTTAIIAVRLPGAGNKPACFEVGLGDDGSRDAEVLRTAVRLADAPYKTRYFAPANLRAAEQDQRYMALVARYIREGYTLRYSGGLVPDVYHALIKGHGVYVSPVTGRSRAKLRRLYELFPIALVVECAGGKATDPTDGKSILDYVLRTTDERAGLVCGTPDEVEAAVKALLGVAGGVRG